jgi:hypothetical protein
LKEHFGLAQLTTWTTPHIPDRVRQSHGGQHPKKFYLAIERVAACQAFFVDPLARRELARYAIGP